jgi:AcrR family transcriptional regulator
MTSTDPERRIPTSERRSERAAAATRLAALDLLRERGYQALTVDAIAERAGVSKATIYRWWPNKQAVLMDAFLEASAGEIDWPDTGDLRRDMRDQVGRLVEAFTDTPLEQTMRTLIAEGQHDPALAQAYRERWLAPRRAIARGALERGVARGELPPGTNCDRLLDALYGPVYYRLLLGHDEADEAFLDWLVDHVLGEAGKR